MTTTLEKTTVREFVNSVRRYVALIPEHANAEKDYNTARARVEQAKKEKKSVEYWEQEVAKFHRPLYNVTVERETLEAKLDAQMQTLSKNLAVIESLFDMGSALQNIGRGLIPNVK
jgi:hypothetical protein